MIQLIYLSEHRLSVDENGYSKDFDNIATAARLRNERNDITGILLCGATWFCQVLEGPQREVNALVNSIKTDQRHYAISVLTTNAIVKRRFPGWGMAAVVLAREVIACQLLLLERQMTRHMAPVERSADDLLNLCDVLYGQARLNRG